MNRRPYKSPIGLEPLEDRLLLSADGVVPVGGWAPVGSDAPVLEPSALMVEVSDGDIGQDLSDPLSGAPQAASEGLDLGLGVELDFGEPEVEAAAEAEVLAAQVIVLDTFEQGPDETLEISIGGTALGAFDRYEVTNGADFDGRIEIELTDGFVPSAGDTFEIFEYGGHTGAFASWLGTASIPGAPELAFVPEYGSNGLTLEVVSTQTIMPALEAQLEAGLDALADLGQTLEGLASLAEVIPVVGSDLAEYVRPGQALAEVVRDGIQDLIDAFPRQSEVTAGIESWDGQTVGIFLIEIGGVSGHYSSSGGQPFWWDVQMDLVLVHSDQPMAAGGAPLMDLAFGAGAVLDIEAELSLDFSFGLDSGFFTQIRSITATAGVDATGLNLMLAMDSGSGSQGFMVTGGSVQIGATVTVEPEAAVLPGGWMDLATLTAIAGGTISVEDAFEAEASGSLTVDLPIQGVVNSFMGNFTGLMTVGYTDPELFDGVGEDWSVSFDGAVVLAGGQEITGLFGIQDLGGQRVVAASDLQLEFSVGAGASEERLFRLDAGQGLFLWTQDGMAGVAEFTFGLGSEVAGIELNGTDVGLAFNTTDGAVTEIAGTPVDLPAAGGQPYIRVSGAMELELTPPGVTWTGDFLFERTELSGSPVVTVGVQNLQFVFGADAGEVVSIQNGSGAFVIGPDGIVGTATADVAVSVPVLDISGQFIVEVNLTGSGFLETVVTVGGVAVTIPVLPSGPYVRLSGTAVSLELLGEYGVAGNFTIEQSQTQDGDQVVLVAITDGELGLGGMTGNLISATGMDGVLIVTPDGAAGELTISDLALAIPGIELTGTFYLLTSNLPTAMNETVTVGGVQEHYFLPAGPYLRISAGDATLEVLDVAVRSGSLVLEVRGEGASERVTAVANQVDFDFGDGLGSLLSLENGSGRFIFQDSGVAGVGQVDIGVNALGASLGATTAFAFNTAASGVSENLDWGSGQELFEVPAGPFFEVVAENMTITVPVAGVTQELSGTFSFAQSTAEGDPYVAVGVSDLEAELTAGGVGLSVTGGRGAFIWTADGLAGLAELDTVNLTGVPGVSLEAIDLALELNNTGADVGPRDVRISAAAGDTITVEYSGAYYHDYLAVSGGARLELAGFADLSGLLRIEHSDTNPTRLKVGAQELSLTLEAGSLPVLSFNHGEGAFVLGTTGIAGEAELAFEVGLIGLSGEIGLEVNTTGAAVNTTVNMPDGGSESLSLTAGNYLRVVVDGHLLLGSTSIAASFRVEVSGGSVVLSDPSGSPVLLTIDSDGTVTPGVGISFADFANPDPFVFVMFLRQLGNWMSMFSDSSVFNVELPFTGGLTVGDALDWSQAFLDEVYGAMVSVELQSGLDFDLLLGGGSMAIGTAQFALKVGDGDPIAVSVTGNFSSIENSLDPFDPTTLAGLFNLQFQALGIDDLVVARANKDGQFVIALQPLETARHGVLQLLDPNTAMVDLGFGPSDGVADTVDRTAVETARYDMPGFFEALGDLLGLDVDYDPARKVYTYDVNLSWSPDEAIVVPFSLDEELGSIAGAELSGEITLDIALSLGLLLGFDLNPAEVPRVISSSLIPVPSHGRLSATAHFEVFFNDDVTPVSLTLPRSWTTGNNSIEDLAADLNTLFAGVNYQGVPLNRWLYAQRAGSGLAISALNEDANANGQLDPGEDLNGNGQLENRLGVVNMLTVRSLQNDTFATEMGFGVEAFDLDGNDATVNDRYFQSVAKAPIKGLFVENLHLSGSVEMTTTSPIEGGLQFGFVDITTENGSIGTLEFDGLTPAPISVSLDFEDATSGNDRFYLDALYRNLQTALLPNMLPNFELTGSFLARLDDIQVVDGLIPLGPDPEVSLWIPDINNLEYNPDPYDGTNTGLFVTYPDLGHLLNFSDVGFYQILQALRTIAEKIEDLGGYSFLDTKLPVIDISVNDMIDYAGKFAELVDSLSGSNAGTLSELIEALELKIETVFDLDPDVLDIVVDGNGVDYVPVTSGGGAGTKATTTFNPNGADNGFRIVAKQNGTDWNGVTLRVEGSNSVNGDAAVVEWDATNKLLRVLIDGGETTAGTIVDAINAATDLPWTAQLDPADAGNTGTGAITTLALRFDLGFKAGYAESLPLQLNLRDLVRRLAGDNAAALAFLDLATQFIQIEGGGQLTVGAQADVTLAFGLDLTNPFSVVPFLYDDTGVVLTARVLGTDLNFEASLGSVVGIYVRGGKVAIDRDGDPETGPDQGDKGIEFTLGFKDNDGNGRHYFGEDWFQSESLGLSLEGGVSVVLPIFAPTESMPLGSDEDLNGDGYPDNQLVIDIPDLVRLFVDEKLTGELGTVVFKGNDNDFQIDTQGHAQDVKIVLRNDDSASGATAQYNLPTNTLTLTFRSGVTTAQQVIQAINANTVFLASLTANDNPTSGTNAGTGVIRKLTIITPDLDGLFANMDLCDILDQNAGLLLDGLDRLLGTIQDGLNALVLSDRLPLVGDGLADAANFIEDFRNGLLNDLRTRIESAGSATDALANAIKEAFWNTLGPGGLDILVKADGSPLDVEAGYSQLDITLDCEDGLWANLRLKKVLALIDTTSNPIDLDIGVPGFGLEVSGNVQLALGFDLKLRFGLNKEDGFYFVTSGGHDWKDTNGNLVRDAGETGSDPELTLGFEAAIPGLAASGQLAFLQLDVGDDPDDPSSFIGGFQVDLLDPNMDGKLTWAELTSSGLNFGDLVDGKLGAVADINLSLSASFGGSTAFPRVVADFTLDWTWDLEDGAEAPVVAFRNVALDLGSFISDFLEPILSEIRKVTEPLDPIIDIVTARLPVLSDLAGETITLLDLAEIFGLLEPSTVRFIENVLDIIELINSIPTGTGTILIPFGSFTLGQGQNGEMDEITLLEDLGSIDLGQALADATGPGTSETFVSQTSGFMGDVGSLDNFSIPIFDNPAELFQLFTGGSVRLVEWRMPTFLFEFTYIQKIPIYPPLYAQFGGSIGAKIEIGFGYDTYGIQKFISSEDKNALDLLDGFYVIDFDEAGNDRNELELTGEIFAGASINLLMVEAGVRGGIYATIGFDLNDVDDDGRVRVSEIIANAQLDPRCIFNIHGEIGLFLEAFLSVDLLFLSIDKTWRFAEITLFEFDITCPEPVLANLDGGVLRLNMGSRAEYRLEIDTVDKTEAFTVVHIDGTAGNETVEVQWGNYRAQFQNVGSVVIEDAGVGDDVIDLRGILSPTEVHGGAGNDTIYMGDGSDSSAYGDDGNDTIIASELAGLVNLEIHGGAGNDVLTGGGSAITIHGGAGVDTITGTAFADHLYGDDGDDWIDGLAGDDVIEGGNGNDWIEGGVGNDWIRGDAGNDYIRGSRGDDDIDGGDGDDEILGGAGNDLLAGGNGSDKIYGHGGIDLLIGDTYGSVVGALADIPTAGIDVLGIGIDDDLSKGGHNDFLAGGGGVDVLFGGIGDDYLYGGNFFANGDTEVIEEDDNDFFDGGPGDDEIFGDDAMGKTGDRNTGIEIRSSIFYDNDLDGVRGDNETGFSGVTVRLYKASTDTLVATEVTGPEGTFAFVGLDPGNYYMTFTGPSSLSFTTQFADGATDAEGSAFDSDVDASGKTVVFNLTYDETESSVSAGFIGDPDIDVQAGSVKEGNTGRTNVTFTVSLSGPTADVLEIAYETVDTGTAKAATGDFEPVSGVLVFQPGELLKKITVAVLGDGIYEDHEQLVLRLDDPFDPNPMAVIEATAVIENDDPIPAISISDASAPWQDHDNDPSTPPIQSEAGELVFEVTLSNPSDRIITVAFRTDAATSALGLEVERAALPNVDFLMKSSPPLITFMPGETRQEIVIQTLDDDLDEHEEHFWIDLYNPEHATIGDSRGVGLIPDDDAPVSVTIEPQSPKPGEPHTTQVSEGDTIQTSIFLDVLLSEQSGKTVTVTWATAPGTAVESVATGSGDFADYEAAPNSATPGDQVELVFAPGELVKTIEIRILPDTIDEPDEEFFVNLLSADGAEIAANAPAESNHVVVEIVNDDTAVMVDEGPFSVRFSRSDYTVAEPETGTVLVPITLVRTSGSSGAVAVFYTMDGTATAGADYDSIFRELVVFGEDEYSKQIWITVHADDVVEGDETVLLFLRSPTGGPTRAEPNEAVLTITDGDLPSIKIYPPNYPFLPAVTPLLPIVFGVSGIKEGSGLVNRGEEFTVVLSNDAGPGGVYVDYQTVDLTARAGEDYVFTSGTLFIPEGMDRGVIEVLVFEDQAPELSEKFAVRLSSPVGGTLERHDSVAVATIHDDDPLAISGRLFYDKNGNGFKDYNEKGLEGVSVEVRYKDQGADASVVVVTDASGLFTANVFLGQVSITVDADTLTSPWYPVVPVLIGEYELTTANDNQTVEFQGIVGIPAFADIGYRMIATSDVPTESADVGRGGTDDTIFGGPGDDSIDAGAGDDHVVGGHWMTATDGNMPVNTGEYDAIVTVVTSETDLSGVPTTLHPIYDSGPVFSVDISGLPLGGKISGQIWRDNNGNELQDLIFIDPLLQEEVLVHLLDGTGNPINTIVTVNGLYEFTNLFVDLENPGNVSSYIVQFDIPEEWDFVGPNNPISEARDSDAEFGGRTAVIDLSAGTPTVADVDAGVIPAGVIPPANGDGFEFAKSSYNVNENEGVVEVTIIRGDGSEAEVIIVWTEDGPGANGAVAGVNYEPISMMLVFAPGVTAQTVAIPIIDTNSLGISDVLHFLVSVRQPTGRPIGEVTVYIYGEGAATISDDDTILGGDDWDLILGDSGVIPGYAVIGPHAQLNQPQYLGDIVRAGGPGNDIIHGGNGPDYIDGQLGDDLLAGNEGEDVVLGGLGDDEIWAELDDDKLSGGHGKDTLVSRRDVAWLSLDPGSLVHRRSSGAPLSTFTLVDVFEVARLFGGYQANRFEIDSWTSELYIWGAGGRDVLAVSGDMDMTLTDVNMGIIQTVFFYLANGFIKDAALILADGTTYHLGSLETVQLTGGPSANVLDASGYSRGTTLEGLGGNDWLLGGSGDDRFIYNANAGSNLGTDRVTGGTGFDTLDFSGTTVAGVYVHLGDTSGYVVNSNLSLLLGSNADLEAVIGGGGNDILIGNALDNLLIGGPGNDQLAGGPGDEVYAYDTDTNWGSDVITENAGEGNDTIDFSATTGRSVVLDLSVSGPQQVNANLTLEIGGDGEIENLIGGSRDDFLGGNGFGQNLYGGPGADELKGRGGDDYLDGGPGNDLLDGGSGNDYIEEQDNTDFYLSDTALERADGEVDQLVSIELAILRGGTSLNIFDLTGWTGDAVLDGTGQGDTTDRLTDRFVMTANADFTVTDLGPNDVRVTLSTGAVIDLLRIERVFLTGGSGDNILDASAVTLDAGGQVRATFRLTGGEGDDVLRGGPGGDALYGGGGDDVLSGGRGSDLIDGGAGMDELVEERNADSLTLRPNELLIVEGGRTEADVLIGLEVFNLTGGAGSNQFIIPGLPVGEINFDGAGGMDSLLAEGGGVVTLTDAGIDFNGLGYVGMSGIEIVLLQGSDGDDVLDASGFTGQALLVGGAGDDLLIGGAGNDWLLGGEGDDRFVFDVDQALGADRVWGGEGVDTLDFSASTVAVTIDLSVTGVAQTVVAGQLDLLLAEEDIEVLLGGAGDDQLTGNGLNNRFDGGAGNDVIQGGGGSNTVVAEADDDMVLTNATLTLVNTGEVDTISGIQFAELAGGLGDNKLDASGFTGDTILSGGAGSDTLVGGSGRDTLIGGAGNDVLIGGLGNDTYSFNLDTALGTDEIQELPLPLGGVDVLDFSETTAVGVKVDLSSTTLQVVAPLRLALTLNSSTGIENVVGTSGADSIIGNARDNMFDAGAGADHLDGGGGMDTVIVQLDADMILTDTQLDVDGVMKAIVGFERAILIGGASSNLLDASGFSNTAILSGGLGDDLLLGGDGDDMLLGGEGNDQLYGGAGNDSLLGQAGNDLLAGEAGDDQLAGGLGNDVYFFDQSFALGSDTVSESAGEGYADLLLGAGGTLVDLWEPGAQWISDHLEITLTNPGQVEFSY